MSLHVSRKEPYMSHLNVSSCFKKRTLFQSNVKFARLLVCDSSKLIDSHPINKKPLVLGI